MNPRKRYPLDDFIRAVDGNRTLSGVINALQEPNPTSAYDRVRKQIHEMCLATSHFRHTRYSAEILVEHYPGFHENVDSLRDAMMESGIPYECSPCGNTGEWMEGQLVLHIDHINGMHWDNRRGNIRFLCPNCHSQTDNFGHKNRGILARVAKR